RGAGSHRPRQRLRPVAAVARDGTEARRRRPCRAARRAGVALCREARAHRPARLRRHLGGGGGRGNERPAGRRSLLTPVGGEVPPRARTVPVGGRLRAHAQGAGPLCLTTTVPEGDTLARTARTLGTWLAGREITAARAQRSDIPTSSIIGTKVETVEARGKHLFMRLSSGLVLRTHMKMTGSWHVYPAGARWRKPAHQARLVLEAGDRVAVCFNVPVIELVHERDEHVHPATKNLGPDVLVQPVDLDEVRRRAATRPPDLPVCELLLDQQVVCGIG